MRSKRAILEPAFERETVEPSCSLDMTQKWAAEELDISPNLLSKRLRELSDDERARVADSDPGSASVQVRFARLSSDARQVVAGRH